MTTPPPAREQDPATAKLTTVVRAYATAFASGEGTIAYAMLSARCQKLFPQSFFESLSKKALTDYGAPTISSLTVVVNGSSALATYSYPKPGMDQSDMRWVMENGAWKNDAC